MWFVKAPSGRFFSAIERSQVATLFNAILPGDGDGPKASDADAAEYLDRLLAMDDATYYELTGWRIMYRSGLAALDAAATSIFKGRAIVDLVDDEVTDLLTRLQRASLPDFPTEFDESRFFAVIRGHCIEGCFADPAWGGNKACVIWRWYGYPQKPQSYQRGSAGR